MKKYYTLRNVKTGQYYSTWTESDFTKNLWSADLFTSKQVKDLQINLSEGRKMMKKRKYKTEIVEVTFKVKKAKI